MFENLTDRLNKVFKQLSRRGKLSEADVNSAMREVRLALLEADVHYGVVKDFVTRVRERSIGHEVSRALNPAQQVIKIVNEELIETLGEPERFEPHRKQTAGDPIDWFAGVRENDRGRKNRPPIAFSRRARDVGGRGSLPPCCCPAAANPRGETGCPRFCG